MAASGKGPPLAPRPCQVATGRDWPVGARWRPPAARRWDRTGLWVDAQRALREGARDGGLEVGRWEITEARATGGAGGAGQPEPRGVVRAKQPDLRLVTRFTLTGRGSGGSAVWTTMHYTHDCAASAGSLANAGCRKHFVDERGWREQLVHSRQRPRAPHAPGWALVRRAQTAHGVDGVTAPPWSAPGSARGRRDRWRSAPRHDRDRAPCGYRATQCVRSGRRSLQSLRSRTGCRAKSGWASYDEPLGAPARQTKSDRRAGIVPVAGLGQRSVQVCQRKSSMRHQKTVRKKEGTWRVRGQAQLQPWPARSVRFVHQVGVRESRQSPRARRWS